MVSAHRANRANRANIFLEMPARPRFGRAEPRLTGSLEIIGSPRREAIAAAEDDRAPKLAGETVEGPLPTALPVPRSGAVQGCGHCTNEAPIQFDFGL